MNRLPAFVWLFAFLSLAAPAFAQPCEPATKSAVAATVGDDPIEVAEAQRMMDPVFRDKKKPAGDLLPMAQAQVLEEIVNQPARAGLRPPASAMSPAPRSWPRPRSNCRSAWPRRAAKFRRAQGRIDHRGRSRAAGPLAAGLGPLPGQVLHAPAPRDLVPESPPRSGRHGVGRQPHPASPCGPPGQAGPKEIEALEKQAESIRAEITSGKIDFAAAAEKILRRSQRQARRPARQDRPPGPDGRVVLPRGLRTEGRRDQSPGPFAVRRASDPLRRGPARNEEALRSQRADRRCLGQGVACKSFPISSASTRR